MSEESEEREVLAGRLADFIFGYIIDADYLGRLDDICATIASHVNEEGIAELFQLIDIIEKEQTTSLMKRQVGGEL